MVTCAQQVEFLTPSDQRDIATGQRRQRQQIDISKGLVEAVTEAADDAQPLAAARGAVQERQFEVGFIFGSGVALDLDALGLQSIDFC